MVRQSRKMFVANASGYKNVENLIKFLVLSVPMVMTLQEEIDEDGLEVIPQVFEVRQVKAEEKLLVIEGGHSLRLRKASMLADNLLLRDVTEEGVHERYVNGTDYEAHLYEDESNKASLIMEPQTRGDYHITGLLNDTHRIEPLATTERSGRTVHKISKIVSDGATCDGVGAGEARDVPSNFTIEVYLMTDFKHTKFFGNRQRQRIMYATALMHSVSLRMRQLEPPGNIILTAIEASFTTNEPYVSLWKKDLLGLETLKKLQQYMVTKPSMVKSDLVYLLSGLDMIKLVNGTKSSEVAGLAFKGQACRNLKVAVGEDKPGLFTGVQYAAHEIAHLLGSDHDGYTTSKNCSASDGYLMSLQAGGSRSFMFSSCSKHAIKTFLKLSGSACLLKNTNPNTQIANLPDKAVKLPGDITNGTQYCKKYFPTYPKASYAERESDLLHCKWRCRLKSEGGLSYYALTDALDGTPCNKSNSRMKCKDSICIES
ncbi:venom metalloproteinase antarease-like TtrivMP_A isoform X2 [Dermacentor andersoni]|uniref:venom metalloproteinase antarease-like TtrivMP_A isoform X2 n=1 Tax=Dermacentor andersoni TaxID=34620 RepID=UPI002415CF69|nr:venom metalloproteinase antarease-like TtrivMP_A isoform X2 [Dermacentor andersoni]